jgi:hypothetical protein
VAFRVVYIQEAHPTDGWQLPVNVRQNVLLPYARTLAQRAEAAEACARNLKLEIPALLDTPDNEAEKAFTGWPDRLYLIGRGGKVLFKSAPGPFGFHPRELEQAILAAQ